MKTLLSLLIPLTSLSYSASSLVQAAPATSQETGLPTAIKQPAEIPFKHPSFTFVRVKYSGPERRAPRGRGTWATDYPDADLNFTARFHETTRLKVFPAGLVMELTDPRLREYPFVYIAEGGNMRLSSEEVASLRGYLLGGGFLMAVFCHNTDLGDGWEREGVDDYYHREFSLKKAYPMGINIVVYALSR